eukprot:m.101372 g.101372  ORF g.101372 m.101372 type:complete len:664 (-) comp13742_c0_seq5:225-2216(-)
MVGFKYISLEAASQDTPAYRESISAAEEHIRQMRHDLQGFAATCKNMVEKGEEYANSVREFVSQLRDMSLSEDDAELHNDTINCCATALDELELHNQLLRGQVYNILHDPVQTFIDSDIKNVMETGKMFHKLSDEVDASRSRYAAVPRAKSSGSDIEESSRILFATEASFLHVSLDYAFKLNILFRKRRTDMIERLVAYLAAHLTHFAQGHDLLRDLEPTMKQFMVQMGTESTANEAAKARMEETRASSQIAHLNRNMPREQKSQNFATKGYLYRKESNTFKSWQRYFFEIKHGALYMTRRKSKNNEAEKIVEDLRVSTVRPAKTADRPNCFEVVTPQRFLVLQALSEELMQEWIRGFQDAISNALNVRDMSGADIDLNNTSLHGPTQTANILSVSGNESCADCKRADACWCSINLGITLCIECSGIHRSMGVHVSKVRSLSLDDMEPEVMEVMMSLGNDIVNSALLEALSESEKKLVQPSEESSRDDKEDWIQAKYVLRSHVLAKPEGDRDVDLLDAASRGDVQACLKAIAHGADVNCKDKVTGNTPLLLASAQGYATVVEFLLLNGADINNLQRETNRSALHLASLNGNLEVVHRLVKRRANIDLIDSSGKTAVQLALDRQAADIVTLLRLALVKSNSSKQDDWIGIQIDDFGDSEDTNPS